MESLLLRGKEATSKDREGSTRRTLAQSESSAMVADALVLGQSFGRATRNGKSGQKHAGGRRGHMVDSGGKIRSNRRAQAARLPAQAPKASLHPEVERKTSPLEHPSQKGFGDASSTQACARTCGRDDGRPMQPTGSDPNVARRTPPLNYS